MDKGSYKDIYTEVVVFGQTLLCLNKKNVFGDGII